MNVQSNINILYSNTINKEEKWKRVKQYNNKTIQFNNIADVYYYRIVIYVILWTINSCKTVDPRYNWSCESDSPAGGGSTPETARKNSRGRRKRTCPLVDDSCC